MNFSRACISIVWDSKLNIYGIRYSKQKDKSVILSHCNSLSSKGGPFASRLEDLYQKLLISKEDIVIIGGYIKSAIWLNIKVPSITLKEVENYLSFELSRHLPYPIDELKWWFRPVYSEEKAKSKVVDKVKVFAVPMNIWEDMISDLTAGGIKADVFMPPYMAVDPLFKDIDIYLEGIEDSFYCRNKQPHEDSYMRSLPDDFSPETDSLIDSYEYFENKYGYLKISLDDYLGNYIPNIILGEYALSREFRKYQPINLPRTMIPKRYKFLKVIAFILLGIFLMVCGAFVTIRSMYNLEAIKFLTQQKAQLQKAAKTVDNEIAKGKKVSTAITTLLNAEPNDLSLIKDLEVLTREIPATIWVTNFNTYNEKINLALQSKGSADQMISDFYKSQVFSVDNQRKRKSDDGFEYIYMSLSEKDATAKTGDKPRRQSE